MKKTRNIPNSNNCLLFKFPELSKNWHPTKNGKLTPRNVTYGSKYKAWWKCKKGHEWESVIHGKTDKNIGCPYCCGHIACEDNCIEATHPKLIGDWNYLKNGSLLPKDITCGSSKKVWWICNKKHEWEDSVAHRTSGRGCPYCSGKRVDSENCLANVNPESKLLWHPTKNLKTPYDFTISAGKTVHWICNRGHEWETRICNLSGCPYCANKKVSEDNCLATTHPEISKQWNKNKNGKLTACDVISGTEKKVWWVCEKGHEWEAIIYARTGLNKTGCPYCSNKKVNRENCLDTLTPKLSLEWNYIKNKKLTPKNVVNGSNKKVWWICRKGHEWKAKISDRISGRGCPYCSNQKVCLDNCLATTHKDLSQQWHPTKNQKMTPYDTTWGTHKKAWWVCSKGHEWNAEIKSRGYGCGCPYCFKIELKDGTFCASIPEAYKYLEYKELRLDFQHNKKYHNELGDCRYDFYFEKENKYVEVTSYNKGFLKTIPGLYVKYLRKIVKKKRFVENVLKAKFEFVQFSPTKEQIQKVRDSQK